jgi:hypothetical protein
MTHPKFDAARNEREAQEFSTTERRAAIEMGKLAKESGLTPDQVHAKCQFLIRHEQGLETKPERARYWNSLSYADKLELVRRAISSDFYRVKVEQLGTDNTTMITVSAPLGTAYEDVVQMVRDGKLKGF